MSHSVSCSEKFGAKSALISVFELNIYAECSQYMKQKVYEPKYIEVKDEWKINP